MLDNEQRTSAGYAVPDSTGRIMLLGEGAGRLLLWQDNRNGNAGIYGNAITWGTFYKKIFP